MSVAEIQSSRKEYKRQTFLLIVVRTFDFAIFFFQFCDFVGRAKCFMSVVEFQSLRKEYEGKTVFFFAFFFFNRRDYAGGESVR